MIEAKSPPQATPAAEIASLTPGTFREQLIDIHNQVVPDEQLTDFDADKNAMGQGQAGSMDGVAIRYPRRSDKEESDTPDKVGGLMSWVA